MHVNLVFLSSLCLINDKNYDILRISIFKIRRKIIRDDNHGLSLVGVLFWLGKGVDLIIYQSCTKISIKIRLVFIM